MKESTRDALQRYVDYGIPPGDFLQAVLRNDLMEAFARADYENTLDMKEIVSYVYWEIPSCAWRSQKNIDNWVAQGGKLQQVA